MSQPFEPGDFLVYQLESGYGLLRVLEVEKGAHGHVWHISVYQELFPDVDLAENALNEPATLHQDKPSRADGARFRTDSDSEAQEHSSRRIRFDWLS
jgi:hypothetical protein